VLLAMGIVRLRYSLTWFLLHEGPCGSVEGQFSGEHSRDADEHLTVEWVSKLQVKEMVKDGRIRDMGLLSALAVMENSAK